MTTLQPLIFATWTAFAEAHPDWATWDEVDGVRTHPQTGEPSLIVEGRWSEEQTFNRQTHKGWYCMGGSEWDSPRYSLEGDDLTPTELHAACWLADAWARWLLNDCPAEVYGIASKTAAYMHIELMYGQFSSTRTPTDLFSAVGKCLEGMKDG